MDIVGYFNEHLEAETTALKPRVQKELLVEIRSLIESFYLAWTQARKRQDLIIKQMPIKTKNSMRPSVTVNRVGHGSPLNGSLEMKTRFL